MMKILILACMVTLAIAASQPCIRVCPADCGQRARGDGCLDCLCGEVFSRPYGHRRGRSMSADDMRKCIKTCPADCGCTISDAGDAQCQCGGNPVVKVPLIPDPAPKPSRTRRSSDTNQDDSSKCSRECPADCGCTISDTGDAQCHCGELFFPTPPPPPSPPTRSRRSPQMSQDDMRKCTNTCPADCGCTINDNGEAQCHCGGNPLGTPPPPPPPESSRKRRSRTMTDDDLRKCMRECPADCGCTMNDNGDTQCHCGELFFQPPTTEPPRSRRSPQMSQDDMRKCTNTCPADCGCTINDNGDAQCHCGGNLGTPPPPTSSRRRRADSEDEARKCRTACPADCGCTLNDNGETQCHCGWTPRPPPPPPRATHTTPTTATPLP